MAKVPSELKQRIIDELSKRKALLPCPRCGNKNFSIIDGYFNHALQDNYKNINIGGPSIPTTVISCTNCGYLIEHSLGVLGLLEQ